MRTSEWIVVVYFTYLAGTALALRLSGLQRRRVVGTALATVAAVVVVQRLASSTLVVRDWAPLAYIVIGYWLPALFVTTTNARFEQTLLRLDARWFGVDGLAAIRQRTPRALVELLELAYLFCYPMVPAGFACLYVAGLRDEADRFWTAVLLPAFGCYGALPWLPTRPPRAIEHQPVSSGAAIRRANLQVLGRASIQLNTFPSGHAAASMATALAVGARLPMAGVALGVLAVGISVSSVLGRYHYTADVLTGVSLAVIGFVVSRFV